MTNIKGNPEFGTKYRAPKKVEDVLSEQVSARIAAETKLQLKKLAKSNNCSIPDIVRTAIEQYLTSSEIEQCLTNETA